MDKYPYAIGLVGFGNLAKALIDGIIKENAIDVEKIIAFAPSQKSKTEIRNRGIHEATSVFDVCFKAKYVVLLCKPYHWPELKKILVFKTDQILISFLLGVSVAELAKQEMDSPKIITMMPNTAVAVGEGMTSYVLPSVKYLRPTSDDLKFVLDTFSNVTQLEEVTEPQMPAVVGVSGSGPAYVYEFIGALADAGVKHGLPRDTSIKMAAQTVMGAAKMVLETGEHPQLLRDKVCSPGGSSIAGVTALQKARFQGAVIDAVDEVVSRAKPK